MTGHANLLPILITDDESDDRFLLQKALRKAGAENPILEFRDGADLLEFLEHEADACKRAGEIAALLFLDLKMPLVDGFDVMRSIRSHPALEQLQVVIVSSSSLSDDQEESARLGAVRHLEKFPNADTLATIITDCSGRNPPAG